MSHRRNEGPIIIQHIPVVNYQHCWKKGSPFLIWICLVSASIHKISFNLPVRNKHCMYPKSFAHWHSYAKRTINHIVSQASAKEDRLNYWIAEASFNKVYLLDLVLFLQTLLQIPFRSVAIRIGTSTPRTALFTQSKWRLKEKFCLALPMSLFCVEKQTKTYSWLI